MKYRMRQNEFEVFEYTGQHVSACPDWVRDFKAYGEFGNTSPFTSATSDLILPFRSGNVTVRSGDKLIRLYDDGIRHVPAAKFDAEFEAISEAEEVAE